jgi:hypothetical protein
VEVIPLRQVLESPDTAARLARLLETMPAAAAEYKSVIEAREVIVPMLRAIQSAGEWSRRQ